VVVICYASGIIDFVRNNPELSSAPLNITQETSSIETFKVRLT